MNFKQFSILIIVLISSCTARVEVKSPLQSFSKFPHEKLKGQDINLQNDSVLYDPRTLQVFDTLGICYDNNGYTGYTIVNLKNGKLVKRFANTGGGDNGFNINSINLNRIGDLSNGFTLFETVRPFRLVKYNLDSLIKQSSYHPHLVYKIPSDVNFVNLLLKSDSVITGNIDFSKYDDHVLGIIDVKSKKLTTGIKLTNSNDKQYQDFYSKENISWTKNVLYSDISARPNGNEIAIFSNKGALIQIVSVQNNSAKLIFEKLYYLPDFRIIDHGKNVISAKLMKDNRYGFNNIAVTKDFIFALFNGKATETSDIGSASSNTVLVYDWKGNPVKKLVLDQDIYQIAIDSNHPNTLYGLRSFKNIGIRKFALN